MLFCWRRENKRKLFFSAPPPRAVQKEIKRTIEQYKKRKKLKTRSPLSLSSFSCSLPHFFLSSSLVTHEIGSLQSTPQKKKRKKQKRESMALKKHTRKVRKTPHSNLSLPLFFLPRQTKKLYAVTSASLSLSAALRASYPCFGVFQRLPASAGLLRAFFCGAGSALIAACTFL